jgi:cytosine/adenosine deaminase-related metal-dependent hydrolase
MDDQEHSYRDGYLVFDENGIIDVGDEKTIPQTYQAMGEDLHGALVFPAFSNLHTHLSMVPFRSLADDCPNRLHRFLMPLEQKAMTKDLAVVSAKLAMAELLLSGTTSAVDMYYFESDVAQAAMDMGFRLWAGETVLDAHRPDGTGLESAFMEIQKTRDLTASARWSPAGRTARSVFAFPGELKACYRYAQEHGTLWTMHLRRCPLRWSSSETPTR